MELQNVKLEDLLFQGMVLFHRKIRNQRVDGSLGWKWVAYLCLPLFWLSCLLFIVLSPIPILTRLAITNADRVVFALASALLSFYQIPRTAFYVYITVIVFTGFLQFLRYDSPIRHWFLNILSTITGGISNRFLRKFTTLHFSNPFTRRFTESQVVYVPVGFGIPDMQTIEVFDFPDSRVLDFDAKVGDCSRIKIETLLIAIGTRSTIRSIDVHAPWGRSHFTVDMADANLGRLISYFRRVSTSNCEELICNRIYGRDVRALSILQVVKHFNSEVKLVRLGSRRPDSFLIF